MADMGSPEKRSVPWFHMGTLELSRVLAVLLSICLTASSVTAIAQQSGATADVVSRAALFAEFRDPPLEFAPIDNWWWEGGRVTEEKITWQLEEFREKGIAGTWFYPRWVYGEAESLSSDPAYWSEEWWDLTRYSVEEHERLGLTHWFSNWDLTQFQQDLVRKEKEENPELGGRVIAMHVSGPDGTIEVPPAEELLDAAAYRHAGDGIDYSSRRELTASIRDGKLDWEAPGPDWIATAITAQPWDLDYLSREVGERFAEAFLGEYEDRLSRHIGDTLAAFGADEIILLNGRILYSRGLLERVEAERGYDLTPYLIGLFYDIGARTDQIRNDYYGTMSALLEENFYRPIMLWLEQRGMLHTALSQLDSGEPLLQTAQLGDYFRYARTFHVPGNEDPGRTKPGERRLVASKLSSSVAHLYDRPRVEMCVYYASGWGQTQEENVAWTTENYAKGLNLHTRCVVQMNLMGGWYEWVPPADHFFQPHWRYWKKFADYVRRLSYLMSRGEHRADAAVLYPLTTFYADWTAGEAAPWPWSTVEMEGGERPFGPAAVAASESMKGLAEALYRDGIDFDFMDDDSLARATVDGGIMKVSGVEFRSFVLPAMTTIRLPSMAKLREFYEAGGTVVAFGRLPTASAENGRADPELRALTEAVFGPLSEDGIPSGASRSNARGGKALFVRADVQHVPPVLSGAIARDVWASEKELFHLHKEIGELDVYLLFNVKQEARELPVRFRAQGRVEIWDAFTGESRPVYRAQPVGDDYTDVTLEMDRNEGVIVVFSPGGAGPSVVSDNLERLVSVEPDGETISVRGFDPAGGEKLVRVRHDGEEYVAEGEIAAPPADIQLTGPFKFRLEPTMDNRWGDFRYPASEAFIGAEARRFRYAEEAEGVSGTEQGWHEAELDDGQWPEVTYSYGPYWWHLGGFAPGSAPEDLIEQARRGEVDVQRAWQSGMERKTWQPHVFSQKFGHLSLTDKYEYNEIEGVIGVPENFLVMGRPGQGGDVHYWLTNVYAPGAGRYVLQVGVSPEKLFFSLPFDLPPEQPPGQVRVWLNGEESSLEFERESPDRRGQRSRVDVQLREGWNTVLLEVVRGEDDPSSFYAALYQGEPPAEEKYVPRLRWFREAQNLVYDVTPGKTKRVGWYRFEAPPGVREIRLTARARDVQAWLDGRRLTVDDGRIVLDAVQPTASQVALRVEQERGRYAGAVFPVPVMFETGTGQIPLGDWSRHGLATYSGIGVYSRDFTLERPHLEGRVLLDLGHAKNVAEVVVNGKRAGIGLRRPFVFDVTDFVRAGTNRLEVRIANTLANHMSTYPTKWVLEGQTVSGLLGPVRLRFLAPVKLTAERRN